MTHLPQFAPGTRIIARDAEWLVRRVDVTSSGQKALTCIGLSELVKDHETMFLEEIEDAIEVVDPQKTRLVPDTSRGFTAALLYMEAQLRQTTPTDGRIYRGHRAAMDAVPYQLDPARKALEQPRQRILIADAVGLGKTLEAGILLSELIARGRGKRILVVAVKSMLTQFQKEMWTRFTIPLMRLDSAAIRRVRDKIPANHNPFYYYDKTIVSVDTLKQSREYRVYLEQAFWDIIVIDEAQNVAERGGGRSQRARLAGLLASRSDTLIMLSATPHDGRARSFASLMNMLDPTAIANPDDYGPDDIKGLFIRRFKKDIQDQVTGAFKPRRLLRRRFEASAVEECALATLADLRFTHIDRHRQAGQLFKTLLEKALFSSPDACLETIRHRIAAIDKGRLTGSARDVAALEALSGEVAAISVSQFSKYQALRYLIRHEFQWTGRDPRDRLVIFTERLATLHFLHGQLTRDLGLAEAAVAVLHGGLADVDQQRVVEVFGQETAPVRLLLASDVASEGINLHYLSHRMVHFDIPWSLMVFQQRNGRIDRYGQEHTPQIAYLIAESAHPKIRGDIRILELLIEKDRQAHENIGDPLAFMNAYDEAEEERQTARAMEAGLTPHQFEQALAEEAVDPLAVLLGKLPMPAGTGADEATATLPSLYADSFRFTRAALDHLKSKRPLRVEIQESQRRIELTAPPDLVHRFSFFPAEVRPHEGHFLLSDDIAAIQAEMKQARSREEAWPRLHYLWEQHPLVAWLCDQVLSAFDRDEAPLLALEDGLALGETLVLISGLIPNRKGHPLLHRWYGIQFMGGIYFTTLSFDEVLHQTGLGRKPIPNRGLAVDPEPLRALLPGAIKEARRAILEDRNQFENDNQPKLGEHLERLSQLRARKQQQMTLRFLNVDQPQAILKARQQKEQREIDRIFADFEAWIRDTMTTEDQPYLEVVAVLTHAEASS